MENNKQNGVFINGKEQVVELLKHLNEDERTRILKHIRIKNPTLGAELTSRSITINYLTEMNQRALNYISNFVQPEIMGLALKVCSVKEQRDILMKLEKSYAEKAYETMISAIRNQQQVAKKAEAKIKNIIIDYLRNNQ